MYSKKYYCVYSKLERISSFIQNKDLPKIGQASLAVKSYLNAVDRLQLLQYICGESYFPIFKKRTQ